MTITRSISMSSQILMEHKLLIGTNFLDTVQIMINARKVIIDAPKPVSENKEVREICQLGLDSDEVNNMDTC